MFAFWILGLSASAFSPDSDVFIGIEPQRIYQFNPAVQQRLRNRVDWQAFLQENPSWQARFDEQTNLPFRAWGGDISIDTSSKQSVMRDVLELVDDHSIFGVKSSTLQFRDVNHDAKRDIWYVHVDQVQPLSQPSYNDLSEEVVQKAILWRSGLELRISKGNLVLFGVQVYPDVLSEEWSVEVSASEALAIAIAKGPADNAFHLQEKADLVILPLEKKEGLDYRLCWQIYSETQHPVGKWVSFIDAQTGELLNVHNEVRFLEGTILGEHDTRTVDGNLSVSPLSQLNIDGNDVRSELDGSYNFDGDVGSIDVTLLGRRVRVQNDDGSDASWMLSGGEETWTSENATQAEIDQFVFINHIYDWAEDWAPQVINGWPRATVTVNMDDVCNAYFDGDLNFFRAGQGCNNTGRIADVSWHEWGHGFHYFNLLSGEYDGSMSEGISDSMAFFQTDDSRIAPYFGTNGGAIREVDTDYSYPEDIVDEVHQDGLIFAGAVWDLWHLMRDEMGDEVAFETMMPIFVEGLRGGPTIPTVFDEFVLADDDNGDLSDGTPNQCLLIEAFARHGLGPNGGAGLYSLTHTPLPNQVANGNGYELAADLQLFAENCIENNVSNVIAQYSWDDGNSWESIELLVSSDEVSGLLPAAPAGTVVQYYIELEDDNGDVSILPSGGDINPYMFYVGELEELFCTDFEADDGGFSHSLISGEDQEGADDWMWGKPLGYGGDPDFASSGEYVWGNDLGGEINGSQYNGEYQNDKHNQLNSPEFSVEGYERVVLVYDRWLQVEDGYYDQARILMNGNEIWTNHATSENSGEEHHQDQQWQPHSIAMSVDDIQTVQFSWTVETDRGLTMGGWNIDNMCLYGVPESAGDDGIGGDGVDEDGLKAGCSTGIKSSHLLGFLPMIILVGFRRR